MCFFLHLCWNLIQRWSSLLLVIHCPKTRFIYFENSKVVKAVGFSQSARDRFLAWTQSGWPQAQGWKKEKGNTLDLDLNIKSNNWVEGMDQAYNDVIKINKQRRMFNEWKKQHSRSGHHHRLYIALEADACTVAFRLHMNQLRVRLGGSKNDWAWAQVGVYWRFFKIHFVDLINENYYYYFFKTCFFIWKF